MGRSCNGSTYQPKHGMERTMTTSESKRPATATPAPARGRPKRAARGASGIVGTARTSATMVIGRVPATVEATRSGARGTTSALRNLPDSTLRWLAASSVGLGAGLYLAGKPRLLIAAGMAPALFMGAAIVGRPTQPAVPTKVR